jgi:transcriptional regulator of arginine metabolism
MSRNGGALKSKRQQAILSLLSRERLGSQEEIRGRLFGLGLDATQSTISRDIEELGLARIHDADGTRYVDPGRAELGRPTTILQHALTEFALSLTPGAGELLVVHTPPGAANALAEAMDRASLREIAGTIAGDDTILVVPKRGTTARSVARVLTALMEA